jgi:hypothetical protein
MSTNLIKIYYNICQHYSNTLWTEVQRQSNNSHPKFTDEECMACYIYGITKGFREVKTIHSFLKEFYSDWFPNLPAYQNFCRRINFLAPALETLYKIMQTEEGENLLPEHVMDSMPIIVAGMRRSGIARVAKGVCSKGYCSSKGMYYYGVKLHVLGQKRYKTLPKIRMTHITPASYNDISVAKYRLDNAIYDADIFADKMYANKFWQVDLLSQNVSLYTPVKLKKGQKELSVDDKIFSKWVSSIRQPIESFFAWVHRKTGIQHASGVRSANGLLSFIFARLIALAFF